VNKGLASCHNNHSIAQVDWKLVPDRELKCI